MDYRTIADMSRLIIDNISRFRNRYDLVVGIPRSGLLPASMLALHLNLPVTDFEGLLEGRLLQTGRRLAGDGAVDLTRPQLRVLIVDDSVQSGRQLAEIKQRLTLSGLEMQFTFMVIYASDRGEQLVDLYLEKLPERRIFEWNVLNHNYFLAHACVDIDGVLCRDPGAGENDYGPAYEKFLTEADPLFIPRSKVGWLVTNRLEKYRSLTRQWLLKHNVDYGELLMSPVGSREERVGKYSHTRFKASMYQKTKAELFIESSEWQAGEIVRLTHKPVFCVDNYRMLTTDSQLMRLKNELLHLKVARKLRKKARALRTRLIGTINNDAL
jgi:uncharacterized HAD superfamily protein/adenine/guanine phosphoribosyltransferase-like PRPP-binding protein